MPDLLDRLAEDLLRAGLSPHHVRRYRQELADHHYDLTVELQQSGMPEEQARQEAWKRLGTADQLALAALVDRRFRSWITRAPLLWLLVLPVLGQIAFYAGLVVALGIAARPLLDAGLLYPASDLIAIGWLILPAPLGWLLLQAARARHLHLWLPVTGLLLNAVIAASLQLEVVAPTTSTAAGSIAVALSAPSPLVWLTLAATALLPLPIHQLQRSL